LSAKDHQTIDLPAKADPVQGGFVVNTSALNATHLDDNIQGSLHGYWGFEKYDGPSFRLVKHARPSLGARPRRSRSADRRPGRHRSPSCRQRQLYRPHRAERPGWKRAEGRMEERKSNEVEVKLPLQAATPARWTLAVTQYGASEPQSIQLHAFSEAGHIELFSIHAEDTQGILKAVVWMRSPVSPLKASTLYPQNCRAAKAVTNCP